MKKTILTLAITIAGIVNSFSQSIPNGGFENWTVASFENPLYYFTSNNMYNSGQISPQNVVKTTDAYKASFAVKLTTILSGTDTITAYVANGDPTKPKGQGIPYNQNPNGIRLYYKCNIMPGDTGIVIAMFKKAGSVIGQTLQKITGSKIIYTLLSAPITLSVTPDSLIFAAAPSNALTGFAGIPGSMLQIDSVSFTGVVSQPVNFNGDFELWQTLTSKSPNGWNMNTWNQPANFQTTDSYTGTYALELKTQNANGFGYSDGVTSGISSPSTTIGGYPFSNQIDTLAFYYKYAPANANDSAYYQLAFKKNGLFTSFISGLLPSSAIYIKKKVYINLGTAPDSLIIFLSSSKSWSVPASYAGADFKVDNMVLASQLSPVTNFSVTSGCSGQSLQLNDNSFNIPTSWTWTMTAGSPSTSTLQNPLVSYTAAGTYTISHNVSNGFGTGSVVTKTIIVNPTPVVSVIGANSFCTGSGITFTASGAVSYNWNTGVATSTINVNPIVNTSYTVTGTNAFGCTNTAIKSITVNALPTVTIGGIGVICSGSPANLSASGAISYTWNTGATSFSIAISPTVNTSYSVTGTDVNGCKNSASGIMGVNPNPTVTASVSNSVICAGQSVTLTASGALSYSWNPGGAGASIVVSPTVNTTYSVIGTGSFGCTNSVSKNITVNALPTLTVSGSNAICIGFNVNLNASGATTYTWSTGPTTASLLVTPTVNTTYSVTGTDLNGCKNTAIKSITVNALPTVSVTGTSVICSGNNIILFGNGANTYTWNTGATTPSISVSPTVNITYTITGTDVNGCVNTAIKSITVNALPSLSVTGPNTICNGNTIILQVTGANTYTWVAGPAASTIAVTPTVTSSFSVTGTNLNGCLGSAYMTVTVNPLPTINASTNNTLLCIGQSATLSAAGAFTYTWNPGGVFASIVVSPTVNTTYTVSGTDVNGCTNNSIITQSVSLCLGVTSLMNSVSELMVYPNPNNGVFKIKTGANEIINISNELGQLIKTIELNENNNRVAEIEIAEGGIYFVVGKNSTHKIVVIK